jgi:ferric enterobactin receptor
MQQRNTSDYLIYRLLIVLFFFFRVAGESGLQAQGREYSFNAQGNPCYFRYICFTADSNYTLKMRPYIFILGDENVSPAETMKRDTLKDSPRFNNYLFIYLPNAGGTPLEKMGCTEALVDLLTSGFRSGRRRGTNLFFQVNDTLVNRNDIASLGLDKIFSSVRLNLEQKYMTKAVVDTAGPLPEFNAVAVAEQPEEKVVEDKAKYYIEGGDETSEESDSTDLKPVKTYFGPPSALKFTLTGTVRDKLTGEVLPYASIQVLGTIIGANTNGDGFFTLLNVPSDTSTLVLQYVGYKTTMVFLDPQTPKKDFQINIKSTSQALDEVKVTAHKDEVVFVGKAEVSTIRLTPVKLAQLPSIGERDVMRSLQLMPGVSASNEASSGLYVRGGTPDQNLILYDGFTVYHVDHLYGFFSAFNTNALKDIQLYKGGFESRYGGRLSSVTDITSKEGNQKKANFGADVSLLCTNVFGELPIGDKFTSFIAWRKSYQGALYDMLFEKFNKSRTSDAPDVGTGPGRRFSQSTQITSYFYDLDARLTYRPTKKDVISWSLYNGTDKLDNSFSSDIPSFGQANANFSMNSVDLTKYGNIGSSLKWSRTWGSRLYGNTIISYSNYFNNRNRSQDRTLVDANSMSTTTRNGIFENNDMKDYSFKSDYTLSVNDFSQFRFGAFGTLYNVIYSYAQSDTASIINRNSNSILGGVYLQNSTRFLNNKIQILPGVRVDYFEQTGKYYFEPRLSATYSLTDKIILKGATGKYYQFANRVTREDIMSGNKEFWILADGSSVPISSAVHFVGGVSYETGDYTFSAEGYYKKITNLTEYSLRINASPMGVNYNENFFNGYGYSKGLELLAQKNSGRFTGWVCYTIGSARNHFDAYSTSYYPANQDVRHEFKIVGMYTHRRWTFTGNWIYASGRPYTAPSGAYTITLIDGTTQDYFTVTAKNSLRLPDYSRLDLSASYKLLMGRPDDKKRRELGSLSISLFNVYNNRNIWYKQFTIADSKIIETNIYYLGLTPNLTLSFRLR